MRVETLAGALPRTPGPLNLEHSWKGCNPLGQVYVITLQANSELGGPFSCRPNPHRAKIIIPSFSKYQ